MRSLLHYPITLELHSGPSSVEMDGKISNFLEWFLHLQLNYRLLKISSYPRFQKNLNLIVIIQVHSSYITFQNLLIDIMLHGHIYLRDYTFIFILFKRVQNAHLFGGRGNHRPMYSWLNEMVMLFKRKRERGEGSKNGCFVLV